MAAVIRVRRQIVAIVLDYARQAPEEECCGLLAGRKDVITCAFPATNVASDPAKSYEIDPKEIVRFMRETRAAGLKFLAIYHSHPKGDNVPSPRDIEMACYSEEAYFIISPVPDAPRPVRAFTIRERNVAELEIEVV